MKKNGGKILNSFRPYYSKKDPLSSNPPRPINNIRDLINLEEGGFGGSRFGGKEIWRKILQIEIKMEEKSSSNLEGKGINLEEGGFGGNRFEK